MREEREKSERRAREEREKSERRAREEREKSERRAREEREKSERRAREEREKSNRKQQVEAWCRYAPHAMVKSLRSRTVVCMHGDHHDDEEEWERNAGRPHAGGPGMQN